MKIHELLDNVLKGSRYLGTFDLSDLLQFASAQALNGVAVAKGDGREFYIAFVAGEAEGAIYVDGKGVLFGDTAVLMIQVKESFVLTETTLDVVEALVMGCRIFDKNRLKKSISCVVPEIGRPGGGIGTLTLTVTKNKIPQNGIRVSLRKDGRVVGSDITTNDGMVGFKVEYGDYDCIVQDREQVVTKCRITFDEMHHAIQLDL